MQLLFRGILGGIHFNWMVQFNTVTTVMVKGKLLEIIEIDVVRVVVQEENNK